MVGGVGRTDQQTFSHLLMLVTGGQLWLWWFRCQMFVVVEMKQLQSERERKGEGRIQNICGLVYLIRNGNGMKTLPT